MNRFAGWLDLDRLMAAACSTFDPKMEMIDRRVDGLSKLIAKIKRENDT